MGSRSRSNILQPRTDAAAAREARSATAPRRRSGKAPWLPLVRSGSPGRPELGARVPGGAAARALAGRRRCGKHQTRSDLRLVAKRGVSMMESAALLPFVQRGNGLEIRADYRIRGFGCCPGKHPPREHVAHWRKREPRSRVGQSVALIVHSGWPSRSCPTPTSKPRSKTRTCPRDGRRDRQGQRGEPHRRTAQRCDGLRTACAHRAPIHRGIPTIEPGAQAKPRPVRHRGTQSLRPVRQ